MNTQKFIPHNLEDLRFQLDQWRSERRKGTRIPAHFWQEATVLARLHGLSRVSNALGLNYSDLRKRLQPQGDSLPDNGASKSASFVELKLEALPTAPCSLHVERDKSGRVTVIFSGLTADEAFRMAQGLWDTKP